MGCVSSERPCLCGLDDSTREYQHKVLLLLLLFWSFLFTPTNNHAGTRRERIWIFFFIVITFFIVFLVYRSREASLFHPLPLFVKPVQFFPPKKRILCLGCKICKDFFFFSFFFGERNVRFGGGGYRAQNKKCLRKKMSTYRDVCVCVCMSFVFSLNVY